SPKLNAERTPAAAGALHVGIVELESSAFQRLDVIDLHSVQVHRAHLIHGYLQAIKVEDLVRLGGIVFERHVILETRAAAAHHRHAQGSRRSEEHTSELQS